MDADGDNVISQADLDKFCEFYDSLGDDEYYTLSQYVQDLDIDKNGVINDTDYKILEESGASEAELANFKKRTGFCENCQFGGLRLQPRNDRRRNRR